MVPDSGFRPIVGVAVEDVVPAESETTAVSCELARAVGGLLVTRLALPSFQRSAQGCAQTRGCVDHGLAHRCELGIAKCPVIGNESTAHGKTP